MKVSAPTKNLDQFYTCWLDVWTGAVSDRGRPRTIAIVAWAKSTGTRPWVTVKIGTDFGDDLEDLLVGYSWKPEREQVTGEEWIAKVIPDVTCITASQLFPELVTLAHETVLEIAEFFGVSIDEEPKS